MKVVVTGAAGFLGGRLARTLLDRGELDGRSVDELVLLDVVGARAGEGDPRVRTVVGDVADPALLGEVVDARTDVVFHLAAVVSGQAEAEFDLGMRINLDGSRLLLDACRAVGSVPRVVFTSSVAVYGGDLPDVVTDTTPLTPQTSYGTQKACAELLLADHTRKGHVDGRVLRLPTVTVRPGKPNAAASGFASGIVREPLAGVETVVPVPPEVRMWVLSPRYAVESLVAGASLAPEELGSSRAINLPGVSVSVGEMAAALERVAGPEVAARVSWKRDPAIEAIAATWPGAWDTTRAEALGLRGDTDFDAIVRAYMEDDMP